jgi:hypothetical protein
MIGAGADPRAVDRKRSAHVTDGNEAQQPHPIARDLHHGPVHGPEPLRKEGGR